MAPKFKFTKEEILETALSFVKHNGKEKLSARLLAKELNSSTKVIFSLFGNMENLEEEVKKLAKNEFIKKVNLSLKDDKPFRRLGIEYILFSKNEPNLFNWLFMGENIEIESFKDFLPMYDYEYSLVIKSIVDEYKVPKEKAEMLYRHLFIYSHGIAILGVTGVYNFSDIEILAQMTEITRSVVEKFLKERE